MGLVAHENAGVIAMKPRSETSTPSPEKGTVRGRLPNAHYRTREYLTEREIERLMKAAGNNRYGHRDATMILLAFRHGLRASELVGLRWEQVDLTHGRLHVSRAKNGLPSVHPLTGTELRALRRLQREQEPGRYLFMSERDAPMSPVGFRRMMGRLGKAAKMPFPVHPHMLRHAAGFKLANQGVDTRSLQAYLGHKNIQHTVRYTELDPNRFRDFWKD
jgi:integrase